MEKLEGCPLDKKGFEPIICTDVINKKNITCYSETEVVMLNIPLQQRVMCHPTIVITFAEKCMTCSSASETIGLQNSDGISPIECQTAMDEKKITCYPEERVVFPTSGGFSCKSADVDSFICSPVSPANGPPNFYGIPPINCQKIIDNSVVECYPNRKITFPAQFPDRILCFPMPPEPIRSISNDVISISTEAPVVCLPLNRFLGGVLNGEKVDPIRCQLQNSDTIINCFPPSNITFPLENPEYISCTPMAPTPVVCVPNAPIPGAPPNSDGITPIVCLTIQDKIPTNCYPSYQVDFPQQFQTRVMCLTSYS